MGIGEWIEDNTSSEGTGGRNSNFSEGSGRSFTNTSESGGASDGSMEAFKLGGSKFNT